MLVKSSSKKAVGQNIATEEAAGKPHVQALAIALNTRRRAAKKQGKRLKGYAAKNPNA